MKPIEPKQEFEEESGPLEEALFHISIKMNEIKTEIRGKLLKIRQEILGDIPDKQAFRKQIEKEITDINHFVEKYFKKLISDLPLLLQNIDTKDEHAIISFENEMDDRLEEYRITLTKSLNLHDELQQLPPTESNRKFQQQIETKLQKTNAFISNKINELENKIDEYLEG